MVHELPAGRRIQGRSMGTERREEGARISASAAAAAAAGKVDEIS